MEKTTITGTVSHGTMRPEDFVPSFLAVLETVNPARAGELAGKWENVQDSPESDEYAWFTNETIWDAMQDIAPDGYYFGAHPGDGSDYGFWEDEEDFTDAGYSAFHGEIKHV